MFRDKPLSFCPGMLTDINLEISEICSDLRYYNWQPKSNVFCFFTLFRQNVMNLTSFCKYSCSVPICVGEILPATFEEDGQNNMVFQKDGSPRIRISVGKILGSKVSMEMN
jgi:hypothetical protein